MNVYVQEMEKVAGAFSEWAQGAKAALGSRLSRAGDRMLASGASTSAGKETVGTAARRFVGIRAQTAGRALEGAGAPHNSAWHVEAAARAHHELLHGPAAEAARAHHEMFHGPTAEAVRAHQAMFHE